VNLGSRSVSNVRLRRGRCSRFLRLVACFILALTSQSAHAQDMQNSNVPGSLRGTVINRVTRAPIARALVVSTDNRFASFSDDEGRFEFQLSRADSNGSAQLTARKPGFLDIDNRAYYQTQNGVHEDITIALTPESLIIGRVNLPSSNQFDRISLYLYKRQVNDGRSHWMQVGEATTRSNGEFRFAGLAAGTYKLFTDELLDRDPITFDPRGQQYGYPPVYYPASGDFASAGALILEAGKTLQVELAPVLQPYYPVKIVIPNSPGPSVTSLSVAVEGHKGPGYSLGYNGEDISGMLPNGIYTVEATLQQGEQTATATANITVKGAPLTHTSMAVVPNGPIPVNIKDEVSPNSGQPIGSMSYGRFTREVRADVSLQSADDFDPGGSFSLRPPRKPNDNDLVLESVRPGRYWLNVHPIRGYVASAVAGSVDLLRQPLVVGPGGTSLPIEIVLRDDSATIEGTIEGMPAATSNSSDAPGASPVSMSGPHVYCIPLPDSPGRFTEGPSSPDGNFKIPGLPPGAYRVLAFDRPPGELEYHNPEAMSLYEGKGPVVRVGPGQTEQVRVPLIVDKGDLQ
jgi:hypothetical protein